MCIFNYLQFIIIFHEKREKVCSALFSLAKKLIYWILTSKLAPSLVYHGLIRALLSFAFNIMSVQLLYAAGKDQLTPGKSGRYFIYLLSIIIMFGVGNLFNFFCFFVLVCFAFFYFVLFYFYFIFFCFVLFLFCSVVVVFLCFFCFGF